MRPIYFIMNDTWVNMTWVVVYNGSLYPTVSVKTVSAKYSVIVIDSRYMHMYGYPHYYASREEAWVAVYACRHIIVEKYNTTIDFNFSDSSYDQYRSRIERAR